jgi:hypothetical protein
MGLAALSASRAQEKIIDPPRKSQVGACLEAVWQTTPAQHV